MSHDVVLTGFRLNTGEPPARVLERVLGLEPAKARAATQRFPVILARTSLERADQLAEILREAGAMVDVREAVSVARPSAQMAQAHASAAPAPAAAMPPPPPAAAPPPPGIRAVPTPLGATSPMGLPTIAGLPPLPGVAAKSAASAPAVDLANPAALPAEGPPRRAPMPFTLSAPPGLAAPQPAQPAPAALSIAQPENDWNMQALAPMLPPVEALEPEPPAQPKAPMMTAYALGDLQLDIGKKPAPAPAPAAAVSHDGGLADVDLNAPAPSAQTAELELDTNAAPAPVQLPAARAAAPAPAAEAPAFGGMASFGDGFDDMNQTGTEAALELDRDATWLKGQKKPESTAAKAAPPPAQDEYGEAALPRRAPPPKIVAPKPLSFKERLQYALHEALATAKVVLVHALAILAMACVTGIAVAYGRSPDALFELVGLSAAPPPPSELRIPVVSPLAIPPLLREARIHPALRLVPEQLSLEVATALRARVPGWHHVDVKWPRPADLAGHHVECMLVEHQKGDKVGREAASRVHALLRTGLALEMPPEVQKALRDNALTRRDEQGLKKRFTQLCLAL